MAVLQLLGLLEHLKLVSSQDAFGFSLAIDGASAILAANLPMGIIWSIPNAYFLIALGFWFLVGFLPAFVVRNNRALIVLWIAVFVLSTGCGFFFLRLMEGIGP